MEDILLQKRLKMALPERDEVVQALPADTASCFRRNRFSATRAVRAEKISRRKVVSNCLSYTDWLLLTGIRRSRGIFCGVQGA